MKVMKVMKMQRWRDEKMKSEDGVGDGDGDGDFFEYDCDWDGDRDSSDEKLWKTWQKLAHFDGHTRSELICCKFNIPPKSGLAELSN